MNYHATFAKLQKLLQILLVGTFRRAWFKTRIAASVEHRAALRGLSGCRTVVDIGANRGQFALAAHHWIPDAEIISFEPLRDPAKTFRSVFAGDRRVTLHEAAIGPQDRAMTMHVSARDDSSSLLPMTAEQVELFPGTEQTGTSIVNVGRLTTFIEGASIRTPALLKIDVQGFELLTLKGCQALLSKFAHVYIECSFVELYAGQALADEVIASLRHSEFRVRGVYNVSYDLHGKAIQADFLFERARHLDGALAN